MTLGIKWRGIAREHAAPNALPSVTSRSRKLAKKPNGATSDIPRQDAPLPHPDGACVVRETRAHDQRIIHDKSLGRSSISERTGSCRPKWWRFAAPSAYVVVHGVAVERLRRFRHGTACDEAGAVEVRDTLTRTGSTPIRPVWLMTFDAVLRDPASSATSRKVTRFFSDGDLPGLASLMVPPIRFEILPSIPATGAILAPHHENPVAAHGIRAVFLTPFRLEQDDRLALDALQFDFLLAARQIEIERGVGRLAHGVQNVGIVRSAQVSGQMPRPSQPTKSPRVRIAGGMPSSSHSSASSPALRDRR